MLHNNQEYTSQTSSHYRDYQINDPVSDKQTEISPLTSKIKGAANSNESLASMTVHFSPEEGQVRSSRRPQGWLKRLLIGVSISAGTAALVAGAFTYLSRREGNRNQIGCTSDAEFLHQIKMPFLPSPERLSMPGTDIQISSTTVAPFNSTEEKNNSSEPYSYYKNLYGMMVSSNITEPKNNLYNPYGAYYFRDSLPFETNQPPKYDIVNKVYAINAEKEYLLIGSVLPSYSEGDSVETSRADFLKTIPRDLYYPLGKEMYDNMSEFYKNEIDNIISSVPNSNEEEKCSAVKRLFDTFYRYSILEDAVDSKIHSRDKLLPGEHIEKILLHKKRVSLLLASDVIINNKSKSRYMDNRMLDDKEYTALNIYEMKNNIYNYFKNISNPAFPSKINTSSLQVSEILPASDIHNQSSSTQAITINSSATQCKLFNPYSSVAIFESGYLTNPNPTPDYYECIYATNDKGEEVFIGNSLPRRFKESPIEISRVDFLKTIPRDLYYPLGKEMYDNMSKFYKNEIDSALSSVSNDSEEEKRSAVKQLLDKFYRYSVLEKTVEDKNHHLEKLFPAEHIEEILTHKKRASSLLAADVIINNKSKFHYMANRMLDDNKYTELKIQEIKNDVYNYLMNISNTEFPSRKNTSFLRPSTNFFMPSYDKLSSIMEIQFNMTNRAPEYANNIYVGKNGGESIFIGNLLPKRFEKNPAEISKADFLKTIPRDLYYPLGKEMYDNMSEFYKNQIDDAISSVSNGSEEEKRSAVKCLLDTFYKYDVLEDSVNDKNRHLEKLLPDEHIENILIHRKRVSLLLASDVIINNTSKSQYMANRMSDNTEYTEQQIIEMKNNSYKYINTTN